MNTAYTINHKVIQQFMLVFPPIISYTWNTKWGTPEEIDFNFEQRFYERKEHLSGRPVSFTLL